MGIFGNIKKEMYINRLVRVFQMAYGCGDMAAIFCLRSDYTKDELKRIFDRLSEVEKSNDPLSGDLKLELFYNPPFKEKFEDVVLLDEKLGHK